MTKRKTILLIDDDYQDVKSVQSALNKLKTDHDLYIVDNALDALAFINGNSPEGIKVRPDIILLDINTKKMNGMEFLGIIKIYYSLKNIKIFVMTTSAEDYDVISAQNLGVTGWILKPLDFESSKNGNFSSAVDKLKKELCGSEVKMFFPFFAMPGIKISSALKAKTVILNKIFSFQASYFPLVKMAVLSVAVCTTAGVMIYNGNERGNQVTIKKVTRENKSKPTMTKDLQAEVNAVPASPALSLAKQNKFVTTESPAALAPNGKTAVEKQNQPKAYKVAAVEIDEDPETGNSNDRDSSSTQVQEN